MKLRKVTTVTSLLLAPVLVLGMACSDEDGESGADTTLRPGANGADVEQTDALPTADPTLTLPPENSEANDREDFVDTVTAQLEQIRLRLDEVEAEVVSAGDDVTNDAEARLDAINTRFQETEEQLARVESASDEEYESIKRDVEANVQSMLTETQQLADEVGI